LVSVNDEDDGKEEWMVDSSSDIVWLNPLPKGPGDEMDEEGDEDELMMTTPSKHLTTGRGQKRR